MNTKQQPQHGPPSLRNSRVKRGGETLDRFLSGRPDVDWRRGAYYSKRRLGRLLNPQLLDDRIMNGLWERSAERVGIAA